MGRRIKQSKNDLSWKEHWKNMPEYVQDDRESIKALVVHFETIEDMELFSKLIGRPITMKTKGIFFPVKDKKEKMVYVDEP